MVGGLDMGQVPKSEFEKKKVTSSPRVLGQQRA